LKPLFVLLLILGARLLPGQASDAGPRGGALYRGKEPLSGKVRGHDESLPAEAVRCGNCHDAAEGARLSRVPAPHLDRSLLLEPRQRRGGPPSRYDQAAFCKLLRSGVDPASIVVAREMPIYELDQNQCIALWSFLIGREPADVKQAGK
jgi:hypothetical protein